MAFAAMNRTAWAAVLAIGSLCVAQQVPPPEDGDKIVTVKRVGDEVEMRDAANGSPLIIPKGIYLWEDKNNANSLKPTVQVQAQPAGFDVIYTFTNKGGAGRKMGALNVGIVTLGSRVTYPDVRLICEPLVADYVEGYKVKQMQYPDTLYSPAWVLENDAYAVGFSIQYPILDYQHNVRLALTSPDGRFADGEGGRGWKLEFLLSNVGNETEENKILYPGLIAPGETRVYVVSVRVTRKPSEWVRTLVPYRNWFRGEYGGVSYVRQPRPINIRSFSSGELCTDDNPLGFGDSRPDINGWGPIVTGLLERTQWDTIMLQTCSGSYRVHYINNFPYQFATNWNATPQLATATDPGVGFPRMPAAGQKIGIWWGRSVQVADKWDDDALTPFDPSNLNHRKRAFAEMDLAVKAGVTTVGLDTLSPRCTPMWKLVPWLHDLKARYPGVRFAAEPVCSDLIHREIGTMYRGNKDRGEVNSPDQIDGFYNPFYMADFLLPGHETWGKFRWATYEDFGIFYTDEEKTAKLEQIASLGYVPCPSESFDLKDLNIKAAKSWEFTVPADLQVDEVGVPVDVGAAEQVKGVATVTWTDTSSNEAGFRVERQTWIQNAWAGAKIVGVAGPNATSLNDVPPPGSHHYRVRAFNDQADSGWSGYAPLLPAAPTDLGAVNLLGVVTLVWVDRSNLEAKFTVQRERKVNGVWTGTKTIAKLGKDIITYMDTPGSGTWHYHVRAENAAGDSAYTPWQEVTVP